jgi:hypothetical protein
MRGIIAPMRSMLAWEKSCFDADAQIIAGTTRHSLERLPYARSQV